MLCERCKQNMATVHISKTINEKHTEMYLCPSCAEKMGIAGGGLFGFFQFPFESVQHKKECPACHATADFYRRTGRLSCPECYDAFRYSTDEVLKKIHGATRHKGSMSSKPSEIEKLKIQLKEAVEAERFEDAALLRDKIREYEKRGE